MLDCHTGIEVSAISYTQIQRYDHKHYKKEKKLLNESMDYHSYIILSNYFENHDLYYPNYRYLLYHVFSGKSSIGTI